MSEELVESIIRAGDILEPRSATVNLVIVDDSYIREINREFRNLDKPTDVISFSYLDDSSNTALDGEDVGGEVYVSYQTVEKEAKQLGVDPGSLFLRVGVHGLLHVIGFDHETDDDAAAMEREEKAILSRVMGPEELETLF
jgi:probable rRNA maturation factor